MAFTENKSARRNVPAKRDPMSDQKEAAKTFAKTVRRRRATMGLVSFTLLVIVPVVLAGWYYFAKAVDQYATEFHFAVRSNSDMAGAESLLGMLSGGSAMTGSDSYIVVEYMTSLEIVRQLDERLDLRTMFRLPDDDPVHAFGEDEAIEDLRDYWGWMISADYDVSKGIINARVWAFTREDSFRIATEVLVLADELVNELSRDARNAALLYANQQLDVTGADVTRARVAIQDFRNAENIYDPTADAQRIYEQIATIEQNIIEVTTELETQIATKGESAASVAQLRERLSALERQLVKVQDSIDDRLPILSRVYEGLQAEYEIALQTYAASLQAKQQAEAVATQRQVFLSKFDPPRPAEASLYPIREEVVLIILVCCIGIWGILHVVMLNIRDAML
ncbi:MAG: hypothetical protein AAFV62_01990 [Pseudomonadota bacterium]